MALFDKFLTHIERLRSEKDCPDLIGALDSEDPDYRAAAAQALCKSGASAVPDLLDALENAGPASRARMAEALASTGASSAPLLLALITRASPALRVSIGRAIAGTPCDSMFEVLLPALHHEQPAMRCAAVFVLRGMGRKAIPHLAAALRDKDRSVRKEAAGALAALRWTPDNPLEKVQFYFLLEDWAELAKLQGAAVPTLLKALGSKETRIRCESARTLGKIRDPRAIPGLIAAVEDPEMDVRIRAVEALGEIGDDRAKPPLVEALHDPHHQVRMEAAWALDRLDWIPQSDIERADYLIAREQWNELVRMGRPAIPPLIQALEVEYSGVRTGASEALRHLGQPAFDALNAAMRAKSPRLREEARSALEYIRLRQEENSRMRPIPEDPSEYDRELEEALAARKRIEEQLGPMARAHNRPPRNRPRPPVQEEAVQPVADEKAAGPEPAARQPVDAVDLDTLLEESRRAEETWTGVKARIRQRKRVSLDEIVPAGDEEQAAEEEEDAGNDAPAPEASDAAVMPDPVLPAAPSKDALDPVPERAALERYLNALQSDDEEIRATAVAALRSFGKPAVAFLILALADPHPGVRIAAAEGLGELGDEDGVDPLVRLTGDPERDVRIAAAGALGGIGDLRAVGPLIRLFSDGYPLVRAAAAAAVAAFGRDALEPLAAALSDPLPTVRLTAARALGTVGDPRAIPLLIGHLDDPAREVGVVAARTLGGFGRPAVEPLSLVLREGGRERRLAAVDALAGIDSVQAKEALQYALGDEDNEVRSKAAAVLLRRRRAADVRPDIPGDPSWQEVKPLIIALKSKSQEVQVSAATRLIGMGRPAAEGLILALKDEDPELRAAAAGVLGEMREAAGEPLMNALNDTDRFVRLVAAQNLGNIGDKQATEVLIASLQREPDPAVRAAVAEALGYLGSRQAIEPLALALRDRDEFVKVAAARSLGYIGDNHAIEPLVQALSDVDDRVRYAALEALKDPGGGVQGRLVRALRSGDGKFRAGVAEALDAGGWKPETGEEKALYLMALDRWAEVERVGPDALPVLAGALSDPSIEVRAGAVRVIARIGGEGAVAPLILALRDDTPVVRMWAERGLIDIGDAAAPALLLAVREAQPEARAGLQRVLDAIRAKGP
ncbi:MULTISPECIES: HEAT repeat domain-containing protein [unclassified Methanoculleus]|jgi:HEAT repeat protein|uniref:HEAT repeat domain-containing protein n=1 Tax=unclassified Methanoculleus TaxID=2619537 RepID=UPI00319D8958